ncbi:conjugative transfer signal peptidase TraF [Hoeflea alexandrii]|nr:conjugative transfer signal peptidase TraF [Hoeflea alexandrii]MCZ4292017.1 conjugative transfer signal peptidase TraF [Hoeflea alexandrii]
MTRRRRIAVVTALLFLPVALFVAAYGMGLRINLTPSYPLGIWRIEMLSRAIRVGDRIFICPPLTHEFRRARERGYLRRGFCPGWLSPLIKTVVALPGQSIEIGASVVIGGVNLPRSAVQPNDGSGRPITPYAGGAMPPGFLFLHSPFKGSYDSRYFGPIPADGVLGLATPILTFVP